MNLEFRSRKLSRRGASAIVLTWSMRLSYSDLIGELFFIEFLIFTAFFKLYICSSVDSIFNFTRPITFIHVMDRIKKFTVPNNASYPWKTNDHTLGFWSRINHHSSSKYRPTYHENIVTDGSSYRFHSPFELPFYKTYEHISEIDSETQFFITSQIS